MKMPSNRPARKRTKKQDKPRPGMLVEALEARIAPAATVSLAVSVLNDADGDGVADPGETLHYTVTINNGATAITLTNLSELINDPHLTLVPGSFNVQPIANDDAFNAVGNTLLRVGGTADTTKPELFVAGGSVMSNDTEFFGDTISVTPIVNGTTTLGGKVNLAADGTFTYVSEAGDTGTDSFSYTITDSHGLTNTATVNIALNGKVWYVDNSGANGTGTSQSPFNTLAGAQAASGIGDTIYVAGGASAYANTSLILKNSQTLIGAGSALQFTLPAGTPSGLQTLKAVGTTPTITSAGTAITLGSGNSLFGFQVGDTGIDISGNNFGTLSVNNVTLTGTGKALDLVTGSFATGSAFNGVTSTSSSTHGLLLQSVGGSVNFGATTISNATGPNIFVTTSTATIDFGVTSTSGGSAEGLRLENNPSATLNFASIQVTDAGTIGVHHTGDGGPMTVTGATTITNSGSFGLVVQGTAAGHNVVFANVTESASGNTGVLLGQASTPNAGNVTFARLNIAPDAGFTALSSTGGTGTITTTSGTINATGAGAAIIIDGPAGMTPLALTLTSVSSAGGANNIKLSNVSGTATLGSGTLTGATAAAFVVGDGAGTASTGGTAAITYSGAITTTGTARAVDIQDRRAGAGNISLNGRIQHTSGDANVIFVDTVPAGTITFSGANNNFNGGTANAVNLTNNTGATISFSGSGMTIATTSGTGFNATGGGTINVFGLGGNTITSTTGTALNVANTTIGVSGLNFQNISAGTTTGSAGVGISLDNTGTSGGLTVTGSGTAGSGGTIQHKTGADNSNTSGIGIYLNNTAHVSLSRMQLNDFDNSAIRGFSVTHFTLRNSVINGVNGNASGPTEGAITFGTSNPSGANGLLGTGANASLIDNVNVSGAVEHTIEVYNQSGAFGLTISNSNIHDNSVALGSDGIQIEMQGTATATINIANNQFSNNKSQAIQVAANDSSAIDLTISGNTITRGTQGNEGIVLSNGSNGDLTTLVSNNTISGFGGVGIFVGQTAGNATSSSLLQATISGNNITAPTTATNSAIIAFLTSTVGQVSSAKILIDNNTVTQNSTQGVARGIFVDTPDTNTTPDFDVTVSNNTVHVTDNVAGVNGIAVQARRGTMDADIHHNHVDFPNGTPGGVVGIRERQVAPGTATIQRDTSASGTAAGVLADNNAFAPASTTEILGTVTIVNNGTVQLPATPALPLFFAPTVGGMEATPTVGDATSLPLPVTSIPGDYSEIVADVPPAVQPPIVMQAPGIADDGVLSQVELDSLVSAAIARWEAAGISADQLALLRGVTFSVENLPGWYLGQASAGHVTLDSDAAGNKWFVDPTPLSDEEFANNGGQLSATATGGAAGRLDALTTIVHELGHQLGLNDRYADADANNVMYGYLHLSERRLAAAHEADGAVPHLAAGGMDFLFSPASLGNATLGANKTLTIVFDATIATFSNQLVPTSVSTQVQLAYNDGSAKTANSTAVVTNLDSLSLGNLIFNDANRNGVFDAGDSGVNGVTLSLFVDANNDNTPDTPSTPLLTTTTAGGGLYSFTGLAPGNYIVRVDQSNFNTGGALLTLPLASPNAGDPDVGDPDVDNDSHGTIVPGNGALSQAITLAYNTEPTAGTGNDTNNTLDFGFMPLLADLQITKTDGVTTVVPGATVTYTIVASNAGPNDVTGATVADTFAGILSGINWTAVAAGGATGTLSGSGNINQTVNLPSGGSLTYTVTGTVSPTATGTLSNTATVAAPAAVTDPNTANNSATDNDTLTPQGDLVITKTDGVTSAVPGNTVTYTITATNNGLSTATGATVADTFPAFLTGVSWTAAFAGGATGTGSGSGNLNQLVTLPSGGTATYTVTGTVASTATGTLSNTATITAPGGFTDPTPGNNSATDSDILTPQADLSITKTDGVTTKVPGTSNTYTIVISNAGPSFVTGATVADLFPGIFNGASWTAVFAGSGSNGNTSGSGNLNETINLASGGTATYTVTGTVAAGATGTLSNTATITAPGGTTDPTPGNNSATDSDTLTPQADLSITKTDGVTSAVPGTPVTYTITASNSGPSNVVGATVADTFPAFLTNVSWTAVGAGGGTATASGSGNINDTVNLPSGGSVTYTVTGTVAAGATGTLSNTATVAAPGGVTDPTPGNNSATDTDTLAPQADLSITKTDGVTTLVPGTNTTYTIVVSNNGPSNAPGTTVADTFPASLSNVSWTAVGAGGATATASGSGNLNQTVNLPSGGSITYTVTGLVNGSATGTLSNTATVAAPGGVTDPTPGNNSATDTDTLTPQADLSITKTDGKTEVQPGTNTYTIVVTNNGPSDVVGALIQDIFPANFQNVSWTATSSGGVTGYSRVGSGNISDNEGAIPSGGSITYTVTGTVPVGATGILSNTAIVTAPGGVTDATPGNNSATDTTQIVSDDLSITKTDNSESAVPGSTVTYTIVVRNSQYSLVAANGATVGDVFPAFLSNLTLVSVVGTNGATSPLSAGPIGSNFADTVNLPIDSTLTYTISGLVNSAATGTLSNTATITAPGGFNDTQTANNSATDTDILTPQFDLGMTKTDSPDPVIAGQNVTYTINLAKNGPSDAGGVVISDVLPAGLTFVSATTPGGWTLNAPAVGSGGTVTFTKSATMTGAETPSFTIVAQVAANVPRNSVISNTATVASSGTDTNSANDAATATTTVDTKADLVLTNSDSPDPVIAGTNLTYHVTITNSGPSDAQNVALFDALPGTFVSFSQASGPAFSLNSPAVGAAGPVSGSIATLAAGATATFDVVVHIASNTGDGTLIGNTPNVSSDTSDANLANNSETAQTTVGLQADLAITKTDGITVATPGTQVTYTITASNSGPSDVVGATVSDTFLAILNGVTWTAVGAGGGTVAASGSGHLNELVNLPSGGSVTFTVMGTIASSATGILFNTATIAAPANVTDPTPGNNSATDTDTLQPQADLVVTKSGTEDAVAGTGVNYTITVTNSGPSDAQTVSLSDILPAGMTFVSISSPNGWSVTTPTVGANGTISASTATLAAGASATFTLAGHVNSNVVNGTILGNTATASTATLDPSEGNNASTASTFISTQADLSVTKSAPTAVAPSGDITYTIHLDNNGPSDAQSVNLSDVLPAGTTLVSVTTPSGWSRVDGTEAGTNGTIVFVKGAVASGETGADFTIVVNSGSIAAGTSVSNSAVATTTTTDTDPANNTGTAPTLIGGVNLSVSKSDGVATTTPGSTLTYTINYANAGYQNATGVVLTETLPAGTTFQAGASTAGWTQVGSTNQYTLNLGTVAGTNAGEGGSGTAVFVVGVVSSAPAGLDQISNAVSIAYDGSQGPDTDLADNAATDIDSLDAAPNLTLTKTNPLVSVPRGYTLGYTLNYSNAGNQNATGVVLRETLPAGTTFNPGASSQGWTLAEDNSGDYILVLGNVNAGGSGTKTFAVTVNSFGPDTINNTASISDDAANGPDQNGADNSASLSKAVYKGIYAVAPGIPLPKRGSPANVRVFDIATGTELPSVSAYEAPYRDSVRLAIADLNGDGFDDIITAKRTGTGSIRVFDGLTGERFEGALSQINAFNGRTEKGAFIAAGDVNGDGRADIIAGSALGGRGLVKVFDGRDGSLLAQTRPFGSSFVGGVRVAAGDVDGDGRAEVIAAKGYLGGTVRVYDLVGGGKGGPTSLTESFHFVVGGSRYTGGVSVAVADLDGDGKDDIVTGRNTGRTLIETFSGLDGHVLAPAITPFGAAYRNGVRVATADVNGDGVADIIAGSGLKNRTLVKFFDGDTQAELTDFTFQAYPQYPTVSLFVAGSPVHDPKQQRD